MEVLDRILALTEIVERHVERGEWNEAGALDAERYRLLAGLFADPAAKARLAPCRALFEKLIERNGRTVEILERRQREIASQSEQLSRGNGAARAYRVNGTPDLRLVSRTGGNSDGSTAGN